MRCRPWCSKQTKERRFSPSMEKLRCITGDFLRKRICRTGQKRARRDPISRMDDKNRRNGESNIPRTYQILMRKLDVDVAERQARWMKYRTSKKKKKNVH